MTISLLLGVHAHQPAGNFPQVVELAHARCYRPFLETMYRYPDFKFAAHFSGWLVQYLFDHHPQDMALLQAMVERGQTELFGGGDLEPVLAAIPTRDRIGQIVALSERLKRLTGRRPRGGWLTERVWDSSVVPSLVDAGIDYVTVDDYHFLCTGKMPNELGGYFTTEEDGRALDLFPISEALRYRIPFAPAEEVMRYIEQLGNEEGAAAAIYFDDIEKFGIWPETHEWVYERGWLQAFIEGVLRSATIRTEHFDTFTRGTPTRGVAYLPTTSYLEMNEWTLPARRADDYAELVQQVRATNRYERDKAFLRGGIWKNFLSRYSEANWMHKRMLQLSARLDALPAAQRSAGMTDLLYRGQANDAYWHGLFGGLYLPHLRRAVFAALVELEAALDAVQPRPNVEALDIDLDGAQEAFVQDGELQAVIRCDGDASVIELDAYRLRHNLADTLRRRDEHYYRKMHLGEQHHAQEAGIASAHDRVSFKHDIEPHDIEPDARPRSLFLERYRIGEQWQIPAYRFGRSEASALFFQSSNEQIDIGKTISVREGRLSVRYDVRAHAHGECETELNLAMPSCDGFLGRYVFEGTIPGGFGQPLSLPAMTALTLEDGVLGGSVSLISTSPISLTALPLHTVSQSEDGFEKIMQAVTLVLRWPVPAGESSLTIV